MARKRKVAYTVVLEQEPRGYPRGGWFVPSNVPASWWSGSVVPTACCGTLKFAYHESVRLGSTASRRVARDAGLSLERLLTLA